MWDERYAAEEYVYGTEPNAFLKEHAQRLAGPVLSVAEGEGRNAVFLASLGLEVLGVDGSAVGLAKARRLAEAKGVSIDTLVVDLADYEPPAAAFGSSRTCPVACAADSTACWSVRCDRAVSSCWRPIGRNSSAAAPAARRTSTCW